MLKFKKYLNLIIGVLIEALGFSLFWEPNNLAATDVGGLSVIFNRLYNVNVSLFILVGNLTLIIVSFIFLGKNKTLKTILGSILLPLFVIFTSSIAAYVNLDGVDVIILAALGGVLNGVGNGLVFKSGFTSGGTDILEDILCKYTHMSLGKSIMLVDGFVVLAGGLAFGVEPMIYSLIALLVMSIFSNRKLIGIDEDKILLITTKNKERVVNFILNNYSYGITILDANGEYTKSESDFIMCSVSSKNYYRIKTSINKFEPNAFIVVLNSFDTNYANKETRKNKRTKLS